MKKIISVLSLIISFNLSLIAQEKILTEVEIQQLKTYNSIESGLKNPENVQALFINYAKLTEIPEEVTKFKNLIVLGFGENNITEIPNFIFELPKLQVLGLSHNNISVIPDGISTLKYLTSFKCWNNNITKIPDDLLKLPNIKTIELKGNPIPKEEKKRVEKEYPHIDFIF